MKNAVLENTVLENIVLEDTDGERDKMTQGSILYRLCRFEVER